MTAAAAASHPDADLQLSFARHLRDPARHPAPRGLDPARVATYRRLFFNNVESILSANFPVISRLLGAEWVPLVQAFYGEFASHVPLFTELAREFVRFLEERSDLHGDRPFLPELAHYEWVELELMLLPVDLDAVPANAEGDLLVQRPVVSPALRLLACRYPVHQIRPEFQPQLPLEQPQFLLVWRDRADQMGFMELNPVSARLLALLGETDVDSGGEAVRRVAVALGMADPTALLEPAHAQLRQWRDRDILLGSLPAR